MTTSHRATYVLERGTWVARCKECAFQTSDPLRRRAAAQFRFHIRDAANVIDLRDCTLADEKQESA